VPLTEHDVRSAAAVLEGRIRRTPIFEIGGEELGVDGRVVMKLEHHQHSGSFKGRGAMHALLSSADAGSLGVVAASGGNHGAAVAWAARELGIEATIFVPTIAAQAKVARLESYGARVRQVGSVYSEALVASSVFQDQTGALAVHAYDDPLVVAGAGTVATEFGEQAGLLDCVYVACGGGGLSGGMAVALGPRTPLVVCETARTATFNSALKAGSPVDVEVGGIAADALGATRIGEIGFSALIAAAARSVVVDDEAVVVAQELFWDQYRMPLEPAAATAVAGLLADTQRLRDARVGLVICGANISWRIR
jgi:threonine dehydratase